MCAQSVPKTNTKTNKRHGKGTLEPHQQPTTKTFNAHANAVVLEAVPSKFKDVSRTLKAIHVYQEIQRLKRML